MDHRLSGSVAVVTGASRGLGRAFAVELGALGAAVMIAARSDTGLAETAELVRTQGAECEFMVGDVRDDDFAASTVDATRRRLGPIDLLVNNAGTALIAAVADTPIEQWWDQLTVNLRAPVMWTQAALADLCRRPGGRIINVSSPATFTPLPFISSYGAAKAGLSQFTACMAPEVAPAGLVVLAIGPAALTDMTRSTFENDVIPPDGRDRFRRAFTTDPEMLLRLSVELFRCAATGDADHLTGSYLGARTATFDTPSDIANMTPTPAAALLPSSSRS
jgi:2-dehydro-3-deoxy-D-gluconate 5-dehydrogenase